MRPPFTTGRLVPDDGSQGWFSRLKRWACRLVFQPSDPVILGFAGLSLISFVWSLGTLADELLWLSAGAHVLGGDRIYRDFFEFVTPAPTYLMAATIACVGHSLMAARAVQVVFIIMAIAFMLRFCRSFEGVRAGKWFLTGMVVWISFRMFPYINHHWLAIPWASLTMLLLLRALETGRRMFWFGTGLTTGLTTLFLQSDGLAMSLVCLATTVNVGLLGNRSWRDIPGWITLWCGGLGAPLTLVALFLWQQGALGAAIDDIWFWPMTHYRVQGGVNDVPFATDLQSYLLLMGQSLTSPHLIKAIASASVFIFGIPITMVGCVAWLGGQLYHRLRHDHPTSDSDLKWVCLSWWVLGFGLLGMRGRADLAHVAMYALPVWILWTCLVPSLKKRYGHLTQATPGWIPLVVVLAILGSKGIQVTVKLRTTPEIWLHHDTPDAYFRSDPVIQYIQSKVSPTERFVAFPLGEYFYFWSGRLSAVRRHYILPPSARYNSEAEYREFWDEVERRQPRLIVIWANDWAIPDTRSWRPYIPVGYQHTCDLQSRLGPIHIFEWTSRTKKQSTLPGHFGRCHTNTRVVVSSQDFHSAAARSGINADLVMSRDGEAALSRHIAIRSQIHASEI